MFTNSPLKSYWAGKKKARRDYRLIQKREAEHEFRHAADKNYDCGAADVEFWDHLEADINKGDLFEKAGYREESERLSAKYVKKHPRPKAAKVTDKVTEMGLVAVEVRGDETKEEFINKVMQAVGTKIEFDNIVRGDKLAEFERLVSGNNEPQKDSDDTEKEGN